MMYDHEKSDFAIVAGKPTNKAGATAAEPVEPRAGTERNADEQSTHRTLSRARVTQARGRVRQIDIAARANVQFPRAQPTTLGRQRFGENRSIT
jgi:hypothetical protein